MYSYKPPLSQVATLLSPNIRFDLAIQTYEPLSGHYDSLIRHQSMIIDDHLIFNLNPADRALP